MIQQCGGRLRLCGRTTGGITSGDAFGLLRLGLLKELDDAPGQGADQLIELLRIGYLWPLVCCHMPRT